MKKKKLFVMFLFVSVVFVVGFLSGIKYQKTVVFDSAKDSLVSLNNMSFRDNALDGGAVIIELDENGAGMCLCCVNSPNKEKYSFNIYKTSDYGENWDSDAGHGIISNSGREDLLQFDSSLKPFLRGDQTSATVLKLFENLINQMHKPLQPGSQEV